MWSAGTQEDAAFLIRGPEYQRHGQGACALIALLTACVLAAIPSCRGEKKFSRRWMKRHPPPPPPSIRQRVKFTCGCPCEANFSDAESIRLNRLILQQQLQEPRQWLKCPCQFCGGRFGCLNRYHVLLSIMEGSVFCRECRGSRCGNVTPLGATPASKGSEEKGQPKQ